MTTIQLHTPIDVITPKGKGKIHFYTDKGIEGDDLFLVIQDDSGEFWSWSNRDITAQQNITLGRIMKKMSAEKVEKELKEHEKKDAKFERSVKRGVDAKKKK